MDIELTPLSAIRGYQEGTEPATDFTPLRYHSQEVYGLVDSPSAWARLGNQTVAERIGRFGGPVTPAEAVDLMDEGTTEKQIIAATKRFEQILGKSLLVDFGDPGRDDERKRGGICWFFPEILVDDFNTSPDDFRRCIWRWETGTDISSPELELARMRHRILSRTAGALDIADRGAIKFSVESVSMKFDRIEL